MQKKKQKLHSDKTWAPVFLFEILPLQSRIKRDTEEQGKPNHPADQF